MKSRFLFNASGGSVLVPPHDYVLESRPGSLRLVRSSTEAHAVHLILLLAAIFGYLGLFVFLAGTQVYQAARPWENPALLWIILGTFLAGFFALLFGTEKCAQLLTLRMVATHSDNADFVTLRGLRRGRLIQRVLLQTADNRVIALQLETTQGRFREALALANIKLPPVPFSEEELISIESSRQAAIRAAPGPVGPGRMNIPGLAIVAGFGGFFNVLYLWLLSDGRIVPGLLGLAVFVPLTLYMAVAVARTRRFRCGFCDRITTFRPGKVGWTCGRCGNSWPRTDFPRSSRA